MFGEGGEQGRGGCYWARGLLLVVGLGSMWCFHPTLSFSMASTYSSRLSPSSPLPGDAPNFLAGVISHTVLAPGSLSQISLSFVTCLSLNRWQPDLHIDPDELWDSQAARKIWGFCQVCSKPCSNTSGLGVLIVPYGEKTSGCRRIPLW